MPRLYKNIIFFILLVACAWGQVGWAAASKESSKPIVEATLVSNVKAIVPGQAFTVGVRLNPQKGWHTYWENPGDAGMATMFAWNLPAGFSASAIDWPPPERIAEEPLVIYGYHGSVFLPVTITPAAKLDKNARYSLKVKASWLVCKDICIPESATLELSLPAGDIFAASNDQALFAQHDVRRPIAVSDATYSVEEKTIALSVPLSSLKMSKVSAAEFFPRQENVIRYAGKQKIVTDENTLQLTIERSGTDKTQDLSGLLMVKGDNETRYFDLALRPSSGTVDIKQTGFLPALLLFAILGGIILNLMPCVLPVLSLKCLAVVEKAGAHREKMLAHSIAYTAGILCSFAVFAGLLIGLQHAGQAVGWGYQMQSPAFVGFLIYLLFLVGLNLSGFFDLPVLLGNFGGKWVSEDSTRGSFLTGVLATAVATPCTAPFMASAVGAALTLPAWQALLIFEALGFGLALPLLLISLFPPLLRLLPKPGAWMETFRQFLAFPMYASVIWLIWVLGLQTGAAGTVTILSGLLVIIVTLWLRRLVNASSYRFVVAGLLALILAITLPMLSRIHVEATMPQAEGVEVVAYSKGALAKLRAQNKSVFLEATAAWCLTCQVNAKVAIHTNRTMQAFRDHDITFMVADWTRPNPEITELLRSFGFQGVPMAVFYPARGEPVVLPQLLTESIVIDTITH